MKLNIYGKNKVVEKTYEADTYDLMFGVIEDLAATIKLDELKTGSDVEIFKMIGSVALTSMDTIRDLLKDIFPGITDAELKRTKIKEIVEVLVAVVRFTIGQLQKSGKGKN